MLAAQRATESPAPEHGSTAIDREPVVATPISSAGGKAELLTDSLDTA
jgi:hypothetical protein